MRFNSSIFQSETMLKGLGLEEPDIINVFKLAKHKELENLQWRVEYLRNEINMLEWEKTSCTNHILKLNRIIDQFQSYLPQNGGWYDNTYSVPNSSSYYIQLSYSDYC